MFNQGESSDRIPATTCRDLEGSPWHQTAAANAPGEPKALKGVIFPSDLANRLVQAVKTITRV